MDNTLTLVHRHLGLPVPWWHRMVPACAQWHPAPCLQQLCCNAAKRLHTGCPSACCVPALQVLAGAVVASGELDAKVVSTGKDTFFGKTMALLAQPQERGHLNIVLGEAGAWGADWAGRIAARWQA